MGLYLPCRFERFAIEDVGKFERRITKWCKEECTHGKSMLIFDKSSLLVGGEHVEDVIDGKRVYKVALLNITLAYICVNVNMCIMYKIWETNTQSVLYNLPIKWDNSELWLGTE